MRQTRRDFLQRALTSTGAAIAAAGPLAAGVSSAARADSPRGLNPRDFGARGDGVTDDHLAIRAAIEAAAKSGGAVHLPEGTYRVAKAVEWPVGASVSLSGEGRDKTIILGGIAYGAALIVRGSPTKKATGVVLSDLTIDLGNVSMSNALHYYYVSGLAVKRVHFRNSGFKFVNVDTRSDFVPTVNDSDHLSFEDCIFEHHRNKLDEAVTIANTNTVSFKRCRWTDCEFAGVLLYQYADHVTFDDCEFDTIRPEDPGGYAHGIIYSLSCNDIHVNRCRFTSLKGAGVFGADTSDHGTFGFKSVMGLTLDHCRFSRCGTGYTVGGVVGFTDDSSLVELCTAGGAIVSVANNAHETLPPHDITIRNSIFRNNNQSRQFPSLHPGLLINRKLAGVDLGLRLIGCQFYDDQQPHTQTYAVAVDGGPGAVKIFRGITVENSRLDSYAPGAQGMTLLNASIE